MSSSSADIQIAYDTVEYPGFAYPDTHPDRLSVMGRLYGLEPAPLETCRVLEVGCNEGANIIPMAHAMPQASFTGFDLAEVPVLQGQRRIAELGLENIRIFQGDIMTVSPELGEFDYIIAHGLYAWIPEPVRDGLLALCRRHLAPNGVAFISYNALPGSHLRMMTREMMLYRTARVTEPEQKIKEGIEFIRLLAETQPEGTHKAMLEDQLKRIDKGRNHAVFHDDFAPGYRPVYFFQFVEHARKHGLQYLTDAELPPPKDPCFNAAYQGAVKETVEGDRIMQEQLNDFARLRMYRETLLCRAECDVKRNFQPDQFRHFYVASSLESCPDEDGVRTYVLTGGGTRLHCAQPPVIAVLDKLIAVWPHAVPFEELLPVLAPFGVESEEAAAMFLLQLAVSKMVELHAWQPPISDGVAEKPKASLTARQEARLHDYAATLWHFQLELTDTIGRRFLQLMDGTRDRAALLEALKADFPEHPIEDLQSGMEENLKRLYRAALLGA